MSRGQGEALLRQLSAAHRAEGRQENAAYGWTRQPWRQHELDPLWLDSILGEPDEAAERRLWAIVGLRALLEAVSGEIYEQRDAEAWVRAEDAPNAPGSFAFLCEAIGCDLLTARKAALSWIHQQRRTVK